MGASSEESEIGGRSSGKMLKPQRGCFQPGRGSRQRKRWLEAISIELKFSFLEKTTESWTRASPVEPRTQSHPPLPMPTKGCYLRLSHQRDRCGPLSWPKEPKLHTLYFSFTLTPSTAFSSALSHVYKWMQNNLWSKRKFINKTPL